MKTHFNIYGHEFSLDDGSLPILMDMLDSDFECDNQGCRNLPEKPETIVDIGAHVGIFSILMSKMYPDSRIYAVEPLLMNRANLLRNISQNNCRNIQSVSLALSKDGGPVPLYVHPGNTGSASTFNTPEFNLEVVPSVTLDALLTQIPEEKIDLMKVDIEGSEYEVFVHFNGWDKIKRLSIEVHGIIALTKEENVKLQENFVNFLFGKMPKENICALTDSKFYKWGEVLPCPK